ncbi:MAG: TonB-dependent receptor domain-containing protein [Pseudomonas sp.]
MIRSIHRGLGAAALLIALGLNGRSAAQTLTEGSLQGNVRVAQARPPGNVVVTLRDRVTGALRSISVNSNGEFRVLNLRPGEFDLTAESFGLRPQRIEGIPVRAGANTFVSVELTRSENPETPIEVRRFSGGAGNNAQQIESFELNRLPLAGRDAGSLARLTTATNEKLEAEGLPGWLSGVRIDGQAVSVPVRKSGSLPLLPLSAFGHAEVLTTNADVEWGDGAAPALSLQSVAGGSRTELRSFGSWQNGPARTTVLAGPQVNGLQAGALLSGPFLRDTAEYVIGLEVWRVKTPLAFSSVRDSVRAGAQTIARDVYGAPADESFADRVAELNAASAFGRLEWRFGEDHVLRTSGAFTTLPNTRTVPRTLDRVGTQSEMGGLDGYVATTLTSSFGETLGQEFRIGWDRTSREFSGQSPGENTTSFVETDVGIGRDPAQVGSFATSTFRLRETLHVRGVAHHVKFGLSGDVATHDFTYHGNQAGNFWFYNLNDFANSNGYVVATSGQASADFKASRFGAFFQDEWSVGPRLRVLFGARWDLEVLPDRPAGTDEWIRLTGMQSDTSQKRHGRISPRFELEWQPASGFAVKASGGIWDASVDPLLFGEALANDSTVLVRRGFGAFRDWPAATPAVARPTLTLLSEGFQGPRSTRGNVQLSRALGSNLELTLGASYRRTEFLPRRTDLNLANGAALRDQHGREVFGTLEKRGGIVAAVTGSNRRFAAFDQVSAIGVDGWSEYRGWDASLRARLSDALQLRARYTYSQTEDNWFMARAAGGLNEPLPFRTSTGSADWTEGRSDFDVPHRATLSAQLSPAQLPGLHLAALYRYRSGYPFTPGLPSGVDANGDGSLRNDPAFIDAAAAGFSQLASAWSCLGDQQGQIALRNSCRAPSVSSLDARISFDFLRGNGRSAELFVDGLNLIASGGDEIDAALFRINPQGNLTVDGANSRVNVPYVINPNFGAPLLRTTTPRTLRVGFRVTY